MIVKALRVNFRIGHENLKRNSSVYLRGFGKNGKIGNGTNNDSTGISFDSPKGLPKGEKVSSVSFGLMNTAILTAAGDVYIAGSNLYGQSGQGKGGPEYFSTFHKVPNLPPSKQVSCGDKHILALSRQGQAYSWGFPGSTFSSTALGRRTKDGGVPEKVEHDTPFEQVAAGSLHSVGLTTDRKVYSWGNSEFGALGSLGNVSFWNNGVIFPRIVDFFERIAVSKVMATDNFNAAVDKNGNLYMWGKNNKNQLGVENINVDIQSCENVPIHVKNDFEKKPFLVQQLSLSSMKCVALSKDGKYFQWGQVFVWPTFSEALLGGLRVESVGVGNHYQTALTKDGKLYMWGSNTKILPFERTMEPRLVEQFSGQRVSKVFTGDDRIAIVMD